MWTSATTDMIITGIGQTLYMTILSTVVGYVFGLPLGVMLAVFDKDGLRPNKAVYKVLDVISNIIRSIPFLILLILIIPLTRLIVGQKLWFISNSSSIGCCGNSIYRSNG